MKSLKLWFALQYLPIEGLAAFNKATAELLLGADNPVINQGLVCAMQHLLLVVYLYIIFCNAGTMYTMLKTWNIEFRLIFSLVLARPRHARHLNYLFLMQKCVDLMRIR